MYSGLIYRRMDHDSSSVAYKTRVSKIEQIVRSFLWCAYMMRISAALSKIETTEDDEESKEQKMAMLETISNFSLYLSK